MRPCDRLAAYANLWDWPERLRRRRCDFKAGGAGSPGPAYLLTGDYTGINPWTSQEATLIRSKAQ